MRPLNRRTLLSGLAQASLVAGGVPSALSIARAAAAEAESPIDRFCGFTESFQSWPIPKVCEKFREIGLDGLDLTVRPGGHIAPENAARELPLAAKAAKENNVRILMLSTHITDADAQAEEILSTCGELGIDRVKLGYFRYEGFGNLLGQIDEARAKIRRVAKLAHQHNVLACVHIHSGDIIPGNGPAAYLLLREFEPGEVGAYVDPMHMTIEGGRDGWRQGLDLLAPWISLSSMKNCVWKSEGRDQHGQGRWAIRKCPVADGIAPIPDFIATLQTLGYHGLYSMHSEYQGGGSWKSLSVDGCLEQTKVDLEYVKRLVGARAS